MKPYKKMFEKEEEFFPLPNKIREDKWEEWKEKNAQNLLDFFKKNKFDIIKYNIKDPFNYVKIKHIPTKKEFLLGITDFNSPSIIKDMQSGLQKFDKIIDIYNDIKNIESPFYSDISGLVKSVFKTSQGSGIANKLVVQWIKADGKKVWS